MLDTRTEYFVTEYFNKSISSGKISQDDILLFSRQLATLVKARIPIEQCLEVLINQLGNPALQGIIKSVRNEVISGTPLSVAMAKYPKYFDSLYVGMLKAGEASGKLPEILIRTAKYMDRTSRLRNKVKSAMVYPILVICVGFGVVVFILTFVIPKFAGFFSHYKAELPLPTKIMIGSSTFLRTYWYLCFGSVAAILFALKRWYQTSRGRSTLDKIKWKLPVFGKLGQKVANARFANILGALYKAGLAITRGLEITANTMGHAVFMHDILLVKAEVEKGRSISEAMRASKYFSPLLIEATAIGEKSGALDNMYFSVGAHYDMEVQHTLKNLTTLLEPILLFIVFGMVAIFALAIFLPMWGMSKAVMG